MGSGAMLLGLLAGCGLREDWVDPQERYAPNSDEYFAARRACMQESYKGRDAFGEYWSRDRFSVCMQARGWRNPKEERTAPPVAW